MKQTAIVLVAGAMVLALAMGGCSGEDADEHAGHDHGAEEADEHAGHDHGAAEADEHAGHDHGAAEADEHAGHDHGAAYVGEHAGHDHTGEDADTEDSHAGHDHGQEALVALSPRDRDDAGIRLAEAGPGDVELTTRLLGEVRVNEERLAHVVPPASGVVREVRARIGDRVSEGDLLAVIASRELAEARAQYVNARGRRE
ncbi:MAG: biotin/lipoyl-binding protein, partial [Candidatus Eisenbacteria bacterium]|nr:biotin/lipoyl-binding protein [Candidatus Eisenbacteria bacterium]